MKLDTTHVRRFALVLAICASTAHASFLIDPTGGTPLWSSIAGADDEVRVGRPLGFAFTFFDGDPVTTVDVSTNGNLNFSGDSDYSNESPKVPIPRISPLWDDLELVAGSSDSIIEKIVAGKYYSVTWQVHERAQPATRHAFQAVLFGASMRVNGLDFQKDDIVFCHEEVGATFSKNRATVGLDAGDAEIIVPVPGASSSAGVLPHAEAGLLPVGAGGFLLFRPDGSGSYTVTVVGNRAPRPRDDTWYTRTRSTFVTDVLANDIDPDLDPLTLAGVTAANFGTVAMTDSGALRYVPGKNFRGRDTFRYTVRDPWGLTGSATVTVRPFSVGLGTFEGLFRDAPTEDDPTPASTPDASGHFKLTLRADGSFTGVLTYGGFRRTLKGLFDEWGNFTTQFTRIVDEEPVTFTLTLHLDLLDDTQPLTGTLTDGDLASTLTAARPAPFTVSSPAPQQGLYKILLRPDEADGPLGIGFASMRVTARGVVTLAGKLGNGRNLSTSGSLKPDGTYPLYIHLPVPRSPRAGALWGVIRFDETDPASDCTGSLRWFMPEIGETSEFDAFPSLIGCRHLPSPGTRVLPLADGRGNASIDVGGLYLETLTIDPANKVTVEAGGDEKLALTITPASASFRGSFVEEVYDPRPGFKTRRLSGLFLQKLKLGGGYFIDADGLAAPVTIQPPQPE